MLKVGFCKVNRFLEEKASEDLLQMKSENMTFFF